LYKEIEQCLMNCEHDSSNKELEAQRGSRVWRLVTTLPKIQWHNVSHEGSLLTSLVVQRFPQRWGMPQDER
jgi:hypothetical protein